MVLQTFLTALTVCLIPCFLGLKLLRSAISKRNVKRRKALLDDLGIHNDNKTLVGLFHPYCNAGGGGERVLWTAVAFLQREEPNVICLIYTGDVDATKSEIIEKVKARFSIALDPTRMALVYLRSRYLVEDTTWKRFTLLGQSLGSVVLGHEALMTIVPDIFIDTMGYAFTFPLAKLYTRIPVGAYVHYPTISSDMLQRVRSRAAGHTNNSAVAKSSILSRGKLLYYLAFAKLYSFCLKRADYLMVNSSWTQAHINMLLGSSASSGQEKAASIVYPPCDTNVLSELSLKGRENIILSVAQFRPEKEHATQLKALKCYLDLQGPSNRADSARMIMAGSVRNAGDEARVASLRQLAADLQIEDKIEFVINPPFPELLKLFAKASVGLSTMVDEHFGINVVEFMAAGLIPLVHRSGGPLLDIVVQETGQPTGFHASTPKEYANQLMHILSLSSEEQKIIRERARSMANKRFSEAEFEKGWMKAWRALQVRQGVQKDKRA